MAASMWFCQRSCQEGAAPGDGHRLRMVRCGIHSNDGFGDEIPGTPDLTAWFKPRSH
jgi:hypothetical protein